MGYLLTFLCSLSNVCFCPYLLATIKTTGLPVIVLPLQRHFFWGGGGALVFLHFLVSRIVNKQKIRRAD